MKAASASPCVTMGASSHAPTGAVLKEKGEVSEQRDAQHGRGVENAHRGD